MTKGYGFSINDINRSCPSDLSPYEKAYKQEQKEKDLSNWELGIYIRSAVGTAIEHNFSKMAQSKYMEKPLYLVREEEERANRPLTEEEIEIQRKVFVSQMEAHRAMFNKHQMNK